MVIISNSELKKFLSHAKNIREVRTLPILAYVKLECKGKGATITKTNLNSFVIVDVEADFKKDCVLLIEEKTLAGCVTFSKGKEFKITVSDKNIVLDDGFRKTKVQSVDDHFPAIETNNDHEKIQFHTEIISSMSVAKSHTLTSAEKAIREWKCFVHMKKIGKKNFVIGVNGAVSYFKSFKEKLPEISLDPETVSIVAKFPFVEYSSNDRYDYFEYLGVTYGFIKAETKCPDLETVLERFKSKDTFTVSRNDLINFCENAIAINSSAMPPEVIIADGDEGLLLKFADLSDSQNSEELISCDEKTFKVEDILFQPRNLLIALNGLGCDKIKVSKIPGNMIISTEEEKDYTGSVMELQRLG